MKQAHHTKKNKEYAMHRDLICQLTGMDDFHMNNMILEAGVDYVEGHCVDYQDIRNQLLYTHGVFWNWWLNQWKIRDESFVLSKKLGKYYGENLAPKFKELMLEIYVKWHHDDMMYNSNIELGYHKCIESLRFHEIHHDQVNKLFAQFTLPKKQLVK